MFDSFSSFIEDTAGVDITNPLSTPGKLIEKTGDVLGIDELEQAGKVLSGDYYKDQKELSKQQERIDNLTDNYNDIAEEYQSEADRLIAFDEIFSLALSNRAKNELNPLEAEIEKLTAEYKELIEQFKSEYDKMIAWSDGSFLQRVGFSVLAVTGGLIGLTTSLLDGSAKSEDWITAIKVAIAIIVTILAVLAVPASGGTTAAIVAASLAVLSTYLMLDATFANGAFMGNIMTTLDFIFNDILNLDDTVSSDFEKFDSDHEDYQEMVMYVNLAIQIAAIYTSWKSGLMDGVMGGEAVKIGETAVTYEQLYQAWVKANAVGDLVNAYKYSKELEDKLLEDKAKVDSRYTNLMKKRMYAAYKDQEYIQTDTDEIINKYVLSFSTIYDDPEVYIPMNTRYGPDEDVSPMLTFGFESIFSESKLAGDIDYHKSILYNLHKE
jgi:uncharacterized protein YhaN